MLLPLSFPVRLIHNQMAARWLTLPLLLVCVAGCVLLKLLHTKYKAEPAQLSQNAGWKHPMFIKRQGETSFKLVNMDASGAPQPPQASNQSAWVKYRGDKIFTRVAGTPSTAQAPQSQAEPGQPVYVKQRGDTSFRRVDESTSAV